MDEARRTASRRSTSASRLSRPRVPEAECDRGDLGALGSTEWEMRAAVRARGPERNPVEGGTALVGL
jgi:hypothetical protein